jgi:NAD(P)-dependent dehydrogenase (short-subunit alcohol dehydrogenase family)
LAIAAVAWGVRYLFASLIKAENLKGKTVLITGCDSGFGKATAEQLAAKDMKVLAACLTDKGVETLKSVANITPFLMDVSKDESVAKGMEFVKQNAPNGLWAVLNNAGLLRGGLLETSSLDDWKLQFEVNVFGMVRVTKLALPLLRKAGGRVVNVASVAGRFSMPGVAAYNCTKYSVEALSDTLRRECAGQGVKVIMIEPGVMKTPLWDVPFDQSANAKQWDSFSPECREYYGKEFFEKSYTSSKALIGKMAGNPQTVVNGMINAITSKYPLFRYTLGWDTPFWLFMAMAPATLTDFLLEKDAERNGTQPAGVKKLKEAAAAAKAKAAKKGK